MFHSVSTILDGFFTFHIPTFMVNSPLGLQAVRQYIVEHKLEKVVTSALNRVILQMPEAVSS